MILLHLNYFLSYGWFNEIVNKLKSGIVLMFLRDNILLALLVQKINSIDVYNIVVKMKHSEVIDLNACI